MSKSSDNASRNDAEEARRLERARAAAREFCWRFGLPKRYLDQLEAPPIQQPLVIERDGRPVQVFRWLGHGRGAPILQVELGTTTADVTVYGGFNDREFGPWTPDTLRS